MAPVRKPESPSVVTRNIVPRGSQSLGTTALALYRWGASFEKTLNQGTYSNARSIKSTSPSHDVLLPR
jgi:hypothetical protein